MSRSGQYKSQVDSLHLCFLWKELGVCNARSLFMGDMPDELSEIGVSSGDYRKIRQKDQTLFQ